MHQDLETLRSQIIPSELDCQQAELDGTIKLTTPEYGSIEALDLKLQLNGGRGSAMFQPLGFSVRIAGAEAQHFIRQKTTTKL